MAGATCVFAAEISAVAGRSGGGVHRHPCAEIVRFISGTGILEQDGRRYPYRPGMYSIYQPGAAHCDLPDSNGIQMCVGVESPEARTLPPGLYEGFEEADWYLERIREAIHGDGGAADSRKLDFIAGILALALSRRLARNCSTQTDYVAAARSELDTHFREDIDIKSLAGKLFISPDHLRHLFREEMGEAPLGYLIRKRIEAACELLNFTDLPIGEVARRVGLDNSYYFSRIFRKKLGLSPSQYRQRLQAGEPSSSPQLFNSKT